MEKNPPLNRMYHSIRTMGAVQCAGHHEGQKTVKAPAGATAYCSAHRNNQNPAFGWKWVSNAEWSLMVMLRERHLTEDSIRALRNEIMTQHVIDAMDAVIINDGVEDETKSD